MRDSSAQPTSQKGRGRETGLIFEEIKDGVFSGIVLIFRINYRNGFLLQTT